MAPGPMRVLHLVDSAEPVDAFSTLLKAYDPAEVELSLATLVPAGRMQEGMAALGVPSFSLDVRGRAGLPAATLRLARLSRKRYDVLHAHQLEAAIVGLSASRLANVPVGVVTAHHFHEAPFTRSRKILVADRLITRLADRVISPSAHMADVIVAEHRVARTRVPVVHHGFDLRRWDPSMVDGHDARRQLGIGPEETVLLAIGRNYWIKDLPALVRAFGATCHDRPDVRLVIMGAGHTDGLRRMADERGIDDRLLVIPFRDDVERVIAAADLLVHPSRAESFGQVIVEAMLMARPVLSTPVGIAPEVVLNGRTGFLLPAAGEDAIAEGLSAALAARARWPELGAAARAAACAFDIRAAAAGYVRCYADALGDRR